MNAETMTEARQTTMATRRFALPAVAGIAYSLIWVIGLAIWPSNLDVNASGRDIISAYAANRVAATLQYALVEGLAALALGTVVLALGQAARRRGAHAAARVALAAGLGGAAISLLQAILGVSLVVWIAPQGDVALVRTLYRLLNQMDGAKMFTFAVLALAGVALVRRGTLPRWLAYAGVLLAVAIVVSGVAYLLLISSLSVAAAPALLLLLIWVTGTGVTLGWSKRYGLGSGARAQQ